jgi:hypothetical protein
LVLVLASAAALGGRSSVCDEAQDKLDSCKDELGEVVRRQGYQARPVGFSGECDEQQECLAECVTRADCPAIVAAIGTGTGDPDTPPGAFELAACLDRCLGV